MSDTRKNIVLAVLAGPAISTLIIRKLVSLIWLTNYGPGLRNLILFIIPLLYSLFLIFKKPNYRVEGVWLFLLSILAIVATPLLSNLLQIQEIYYTGKDMDFFDIIASIPYLFLALVYSIKITRSKDFKFGIPFTILSLLAILYVLTLSLFTLVFQGMK